jgi:SAM-dependent methyltransferase
MPEQAAVSQGIRPNPVLKWIRTQFLEPTLWRLPRNEGVLDLCCGYGFYFSINPRARGVEGDPTCVEALTRQGYKVALCDVRKPLPFKAGEFQVVVAHDVCEHFTYAELQSIFAEVHRVLQPGARFIVIVPNRKGYDYGVKIDCGHRLFVTAREIEGLRQGLFELRRNYAEPLPRWIGRFFTHNKEVFELVKT